MEVIGACGQRECIETAELVARHGAFEVWLGRVSRKPFSAIVRDSRYGAHLHLPAEDVLTMLRRQYRHAR